MILRLIILAGLFLMLFGIAELLFHKAGVKAINTRKVVHIGTGLLALLFPLAFTSLIPVIILCGSFLIILIASKVFDFLPSINGVDRKTAGSFLFPIIVALCFCLQLEQDNPVYFYVPILVLAICDPLASSVGNGNGKKSLRGSAAFALGAFVISAVVLLFWNAPWLSVFSVAVFIALLSATAEYFSGRGWDNLTIPLSVALVLLIMGI